MKPLPTVVLVGPAKVRAALGDLLATWKWPVVADVDDDLEGVTAMRRTRADLLLLGNGTTEQSIDMDLVRQACRPSAVVRLVDFPQELAGDRGRVLAGLPADVLRQRLLEAMSARDDVRMFSG